jgi:hypothetical protein
MHTRTSIVPAIASILLVQPAVAGAGKESHFDIWLRADAGRLVTGSISEDGAPLNEVHRVFGADFGEDPLFPFAAFDPGIQFFSDDPAFTDAEFSFDIRAGLRLWNGDGFSAAAETLTIAYGPASVTTGLGYTPGFSFFADSDGDLHDHFDFILSGPGLAGIDPSPGIYLVELGMRCVSPALIETDPFWIVFNLAEDEAGHDAAIGWVEQNLVPAPGATALMALAAFARRRRRMG